MKRKKMSFTVGHPITYFWPWTCCAVNRSTAVSISLHSMEYQISQRAWDQKSKRKFCMFLMRRRIKSILWHTSKKRIQLVRDDQHMNNVFLCIFVMGFSQVNQKNGDEKWDQNKADGWSRYFIAVVYYETVVDELIDWSRSSSTKKIQRALLTSRQYRYRN